MMQNVRLALEVILGGVYAWFAGIVLVTIAGLIAAIILVDDTVCRYALIGFLFLVVAAIVFLIIVLAIRETKVEPGLPYNISHQKAETSEAVRDAMRKQKDAMNEVGTQGESG